MIKKTFAGLTTVFAIVFCCAIAFAGTLTTDFTISETVLTLDENNVTHQTTNVLMAFEHSEDIDGSDLHHDFDIIFVIFEGEVISERKVDVFKNSLYRVELEECYYSQSGKTVYYLNGDKVSQDEYNSALDACAANDLGSLFSD